MRADRYEIDAAAGDPCSIGEGERRLARLQRDVNALRIHLAPLEPEYALVERRRLLDVLHVEDRLRELHGAERISRATTCENARGALPPRPDEVDMCPRACGERRLLGR